MEIISKIVKFGTVLLILGYFLVLVLMMLRGQINMRGLLSDETGQTSPARLLTLITTIGIAVGYLATIGTASDGHFPPLPSEALLALAGSNGYYLAAKANSFRIDR
jgi:hypothetical protein